MNLLWAHKLLITTAILFCAGFAVRELVIAIRWGGAVEWVLAVASIVLAGVLGWYLRWLLRVKGRSLDR